MEKAIYEKKNRIAYVTLNRPDALNALDEKMNDELWAIWRDFNDNSSLDIAILTGAGKAFCDPDLFLVAEAEGVIVGAVMGGFDGRRGLVYHLAVVPEQRGRDIGVALMNEVEARLRAKGCLKCYLLVTRENAAVVEFYRALGWGVMEMFLMGKELA